MKKIERFLEVGFTAILLTVQFIDFMVSKGIMVVNPSYSVILNDVEFYLTLFFGIQNLTPKEQRISFLPGHSKE